MRRSRRVGELMDSIPLSDDLLTGARAIADYLGWKPRRVYYAAEFDFLPIGRVGSILIARKSELQRALTGVRATDTHATAAA